ncbi:MAG: hypothetical protein OEW65_09680 [Thermoleophilia bacterium]|nr:hypothetical protein [Thermoleophilia bacterium]
MPTRAYRDGTADVRIPSPDGVAVVGVVLGWERERVEQLAPLRSTF